MSTALDMNARPRKRSLASAYAPMVPTAVATSVLETATKGDGQNIEARLRIWSSFLNEVISIQKNGNSTNRSRVRRNAYDSADWMRPDAARLPTRPAAALTTGPVRGACGAR